MLWGAFSRNHTIGDALPSSYSFEALGLKASDVDCWFYSYSHSFAADYQDHLIRRVPRHLVLLRLGHARGKTIINRFLIPSRRFAPLRMTRADLALRKNTSLIKSVLPKEKRTEIADNNSPSFFMSEVAIHCRGAVFAPVRFARDRIQAE